MNLQHERIAGLCMQLKLEQMASGWGALAQHAATRDASLADFLETIADAMLDRLMQRHHRITLTGESLRKVSLKPNFVEPEFDRH